MEKQKRVELVAHDNRKKDLVEATLADRASGNRAMGSSIVKLTPGPLDA